MDMHYIPTLVAHRLLSSIERRHWDLAEDAADELAERCDGDAEQCSLYIIKALPDPVARRSAHWVKAEREARLACGRWRGEQP